MNYKYKLYGAILGDLAGQPYEHKYTGDFSDFNIHNPNSVITDDTILTLATAAYMIGRCMSLEYAYKLIGRLYKNDSFGDNFKKWLDQPTGYRGDSYGNGCLMRISPLMYDKNTYPKVIEATKCSHDNDISYEAVSKLYFTYAKGLNYKNPRFERIKPFKKFEVRADITAEFCINAVARTTSTQKCIEKIVKCGGDTDTNASIAAELSNYYSQDITDKDAKYVESKLDNYLLTILKEFNEKFD